MASKRDIPVDVLIELMKYCTIPTLKAFRVVACTNTHLKIELYPWITKVMEKRVLFNLSESKINNITTSPIMLLKENKFGIRIDIPIEEYACQIVYQVVTENSERIRGVDIFEDSPEFLKAIFPKLSSVEKLRVCGFPYSATSTLLIKSFLQSNVLLTTIELTLVQFPHETSFSRQDLPNVRNLRLTQCQGQGATALLNAVDLTVENLQITDCFYRFIIPPYMTMPKIRELSITSKHRVLSLDVNLSRVGNSLEKLILKGGVVLTPGVVLNELPNVKTLIIDNGNRGNAERLLDACAQSVTAIELSGMFIGRVYNQFPNLESLIMEHCFGDLGQLLQNAAQISRLELWQFKVSVPMEMFMCNLKNARLNGKPVRLGKGAILKGCPHRAMVFKTRFGR